MGLRQRSIQWLVRFSRSVANVGIAINARGFHVGPQSPFSPRQDTVVINLIARLDCQKGVRA